jgi:hypothetical protein
VCSQEDLHGANSLSSTDAGLEAIMSALGRPCSGAPVHGESGGGRNAPLIKSHTSKCYASGADRDMNTFDCEASNRAANSQRLCWCGIFGTPPPPPPPLCFSTADFEVCKLDPATTPVDMPLGCVADGDGCVTSSNYPMQYGPLEACNIVIKRSGTLSAVGAFATESTADVLRMGNFEWSGSEKPLGVAVEPGTKVHKQQV